MTAALFSLCHLALLPLLSTWDLLRNNSHGLLEAQDSCRAQCNQNYGPARWGIVFGFLDNKM